MITIAVNYYKSNCCATGKMPFLKMLHPKPLYFLPQASKIIISADLIILHKSTRFLV